MINIINEDGEGTQLIVISNSCCFLCLNILFPYRLESGDFKTKNQIDDSHRLVRSQFFFNLCRFGTDTPVLYKILCQTSFDMPVGS